MAIAEFAIIERRGERSFNILLPTGDDEAADWINAGSLTSVPGSSLHALIEVTLSPDGLRELSSDTRGWTDLRYELDQMAELIGLELTTKYLRRGTLLRTVRFRIPGTRSEETPAIYDASLPTVNDS